MLTAVVPARGQKGHGRTRKVITSLVTKIFVMRETRMSRQLRATSGPREVAILPSN